MPFGCVVAVADLVACIRFDDWIEDPREIPGLTEVDAIAIMFGEFAEGPWCWILGNIRPLVTPIGCNGFQKLWYLTRDQEWAVNYRLENNL